MKTKKLNLNQLQKIEGGEEPYWLYSDDDQRECVAALYWIAYFYGIDASTVKATKYISEKCKVPIVGRSGTVYQF